MLNNFKWYRKLRGGIWYHISYNYKQDAGMTRIFKTEWVKSNVDYYKQFNDFKILIEEDYEN